jgi:alkyldihydroxyacetonephosphate synthase
MTARRTRGTNIEVWNSLRDILGPKKVSRSTLDQISYSRDMWPKGQLRMRHGKIGNLPDFIVWPETTEEISRVFRLCEEARVPVIPFGGGSGVCGGTVPVAGGIICDLKKMNRIDTINENSLLVTAQAGVLGEHLERALNHKGYTLGHFPSSIYCSTLGGYLATRSAGQLSTRYGKIEDMVVSLEAVTPDGSIIRTRTAPRSATGPDFDQLLVGSEGTLAIITRATMRIHPKPAGKEFASFIFKDLQSGFGAIRKTLQKGATPATVRLYDEADTAATLSDMGIKGQGGCLLVLVFEGGPRRCELEAQMAAEICLAEGGKAKGAGPAEHWWNHRYAIAYRQSPILSSEDMLLDVIEVATTWSNLTNLYEKMRSALEKHLTVTAHFTHAYRQGCSIYFTVMGKAEALPDEELYEKVWDEALEACIAAGGALSHHHGIGLLKAKFMKKQLGSWMKLFAGLKKRMDPYNILNPHKMGLP